VKRHAAYISSQTLATSVRLAESFSDDNIREVEIDEVVVRVMVRKNS
jgi:hypothetical protein